MKLGIYVGSFNPVHKGHKHVIDYLLEKQYVDKVMIIATGNYWGKINMISIQSRIEMLSLYKNEKIIINEELNSLPFTYQILEKLQEQFPNDSLYLIIGADNLPKFHLWKQVENILKHYVLVLQRNEIDIKSYIQNFKQKEQFIIVNGFQYLDISSTQIRRLIDSGEEKELYKYVDKEIICYIMKNNLYQRGKEKWEMEKL